MDNQNVIASESFILTLESGKRDKVQLDLMPSPCFSYGNKTQVVMSVNGQVEHVYDTRYEKGCDSPEAFHDWSMSFLCGYVRPTIAVERV